MDYAQILSRKYPDAEWTLNGDTYAGLEWLSAASPKPSEEELLAAWPEVEAEIVAEREAKVNARKSAVEKLQALGLTVDEVKEAFGLEA